MRAHVCVCVLDQRSGRVSDQCVLDCSGSVNSYNMSSIGDTKSELKPTVPPLPCPDAAPAAALKQSSAVPMTCTFCSLFCSLAAQRQASTRPDAEQMHSSNLRFLLKQVTAFGTVTAPAFLNLNDSKAISPQCPFADKQFNSHLKVLVATRSKDLTVGHCLETKVS